MLDYKLDNSLKDKKLSFTQQRRIVLEELENTEDHLTADQLYQKVKKRMPKVSIGTVYRNLNVLVELKLVDKVDTSMHAESNYEIHKDPHYHIICNKCLKIDDLEHYRALSIEPTAEKISGYKILDHRIELYGVCPTCQAKNESYIEESNQEETHKEILPPKIYNTSSTSTDEKITEKTKNEQPNNNSSNKQILSVEKQKKPFIKKNKRRRFFLGRNNRNSN